MTILSLLATAAATADPASMKMWAYIGFIALVMVFLALDLGVFHREAHEVSMKESITWSGIWLTCGISFTAFIYYAYQFHWLGLGLETPVYVGGSIVLGEVTGATAAIQYLTGYIVEKSLAMDNIFVIAMIFGYFAIPTKYQHRVLFWGVLGALVMRGIVAFVAVQVDMAAGQVGVPGGGPLGHRHHRAVPDRARGCFPLSSHGMAVKTGAWRLA